MPRLIAVLIVLWLAAPAPAVRARKSGEPPVVPETPAAPAPAAEPARARIPATEIAAKIEESRAKLRESRAQIKAVPRLIDIEQRVAPVTSLVRALSARREMDALGTSALPRLGDLQKQWEAVDVPLARWQGIVQSRSGQLQSIGAELKTLADLWDAAADAAVEQALPQDLTDSILSLCRDITEISGELESRSAQILALQGRLTRLRSRVGEALSQIELAREQARRRLLSLDGSSLWHAMTAPRQGATFFRQVRDTWNADRDQYAAFLRSNRTQLLVQVLLFVTLAILMVVIRVRSRGWQVERGDKTMTAAVKVFSRPISAALLVTLLFTRRFHPLAPNLIYDTNLLLALVPMLRMLGPLAYAHMRPALYGLGVLFLLDQVHSLAVDASLFQRWLLLLVTAASLAGVIRVARPGGSASIRVGHRWWRFALGLARLATVPLGISLAANIVGAVSLAELLTSGTLLSAYVAVVLFAIVLVLDSLLTVLMRTPFALRFGSVRRHGERISGRVRSLLNVGALLLWCWGLLISFRIKDPVVEGFATFLGRDWTIGNLQISVGEILVFALTIYFASVVSRLLRFVLEEDVFPHVDLPRGVKPTISMLIHYSLVTLGVMIAVVAAGIPLSQFTIVLGALGVGIGFGLQNVVNNFISGLILVFERPVKVGDTIEAGPLIGVVRRIGIRSSTVRTYDGAEVIIPNGNLIANDVINWTLSDQLRRVEIPLGVAYGTDPQKVLNLLAAVPGGIEDCLKYPEPVALFEGFGDSSLDFVLRFWTANDHWRRASSAVRVGIIAALADAGIEIPFPQRDLHVRTVDAAVSEAVTGAGSRGDSGALESGRDEH